MNAEIIDRNDPLHLDFWSIVASVCARLVKLESTRRVFLDDAAYTEAPLEAVEYLESEIASTAATLRDAIIDRIGPPPPRKPR